MPVSQTNNHHDRFSSFRFNHRYNKYKFLNRQQTHDSLLFSMDAFVDRKFDAIAHGCAICAIYIMQKYFIQSHKILYNFRIGNQWQSSIGTMQIAWHSHI